MEEAAAEVAGLTAVRVGKGNLAPASFPPPSPGNLPRLSLSHSGRIWQAADGNPEQPSLALGA